MFIHTVVQYFREASGGLVS